MATRIAFIICTLSCAINAFTLTAPTTTSIIARRRSTPLFLADNNDSNNNSGNNNNDQFLAEKFGGYTTKQRLREEIDSPFRNVRLFFFGSSAGSAGVALYFSALSVLKAKMGGFADAVPMDEALQNLGINAAGVLVCSALAFREYQTGETNLKRIAQGGALAALNLNPVVKQNNNNNRATMSDYRRTSRVLLAVGGKDYVQNLARSLNADQLSDENTIPQALAGVDMIVVPVLLGNDNKVGDTRSVWTSTTPVDGVDRNFDISRSDQILAFPASTSGWDDYLKSELEQATKQGFDYLSKGITISVKKNGKILRRATGQPQWGDFIAGMEVLDGSKFGMPGDSDKYGGP